MLNPNVYKYNRLIVYEKNTCMPSALNIYFLKRVYNSHEEFITKQRIFKENRKEEKSNVWSMELIYLIEVDKKIYKKRSLRRSSYFGNNLEHIQKILQNTPDTLKIMDFVSKENHTHMTVIRYDSKLDKIIFVGISGEETVLCPTINKPFSKLSTEDFKNFHLFDYVEYK